MPTVTVSEKGQVVIPADIRRRLGIQPGARLAFTLEGNAIRVELEHALPRTRLDDGYGLLKCTRSGTRHLDEFDVAEAMREDAS